MVYIVFRSRIVLALLLALIVSPAFAADDVITVPIQVHGVYLYIDVRVNDKPATFVIDSGASANVVTPQAVQRLGLTTGKSDAKVTGAAGPGGMVPIAPIALLSIGSLSLEDQSAFVIDLPEVLSCDGLLGTPFLRSRVMTIDYEHRRLTMTAPAAFTAPTDASSFKFRLQGGTPFVEAKANGHSGWFRVDTGAGDGISLFNAFVEKNKLRDPSVPVLRIPVGRGIGGILYGDMIRLPEFVLGPFRWERLVIQLSQQTQGTFADTKNAGNLGGDLWQRFTITLDYKHSRMYLAPNTLLNQPFQTPRSGLAVDRQNGVTTIINVAPGSAGAEAGIVTGDIVLAVNDTPIQQFAPWDLAALLRKDAGTKIRLRLLRSDKTEREVTITLRDQL